jgi:photosystem II stability/assembly factor-like uncharacterized protein
MKRFMILILLSVFGIIFNSLPLSAQTDPVVYVPVVSSELFVVGAPNPQTGLFLSRDNGQSWIHKGWKNIRAFCVAVEPHSGGDIIYVASGNGVLKTEDAGKSWRVMTDWRITEVMDIRVDYENPDNVYIVTAYGAYRSKDAGWTWTEQNTGLQQTYLSALLIDTQNPAILYAGGESGLYRSTNRMETWEYVEFEHMPVRAIAQSNSSPEIIFVGTEDDGIFRSTDQGITWEQLRNGLHHSTFYSLIIDPMNNAVIYGGGFETGVYKSVDGGNSWQRYTRGLTNVNVPAIAVHPVDTDIVFAGTNGGGLFRSNDGGRIWEHIALESAEIYTIIVQ